jgi:VanZ family protein
MANSNWLQVSARVAFVAILILVLVLTLSPTGAYSAVVNDKLAHFCAFLLLCALGVLAWGRRGLLGLGLGLPLFGGLIEILQAMPWVQRDPSVLDWLADIGGAAAILVLVWLTGRSRRTGERSEPADQPTG